MCTYNVSLANYKIILLNEYPDFIYSPPKEVGKLFNGSYNKTSDVLYVRLNENHCIVAYQSFNQEEIDVLMKLGHKIGETQLNKFFITKCNGNKKEFMSLAETALRDKIDVASR